MIFRPGLHCPRPDERGYWLLFSKDNVLYFGREKDIRFPVLKAPSELGLRTEEPVYIGELDGKNVFAAQVIETEEVYYNCCGVASFTYASPRDLYEHVGDEWFSVLCRALHICRWSVSWKFCPSCGSPMKDSEKERAKICTSCGRTVYPVIAPAVIVAVTRGDKILLAHNLRYNHVPERYSVLAGFVESGESAEDAIRRELMEEVGITVKNIRYFGSQSWPFPDSLMLGYTAEYESGEVVPDGEELDKAGWFGADELPDIPPFVSISRRLIENFKDNNR